MATTYAKEVQPQEAAPPGKSSGAVQGGRVRVWRASFDMASQADGDNIVLARIPAGHTFLFGVLNPSATMGATATVAIGAAGATGKYRAAAVATSAGPALFGVTSAASADPIGASGESVVLTIGAAALPSSGSAVVELFFSAP